MNAGARVAVLLALAACQFPKPNEHGGGGGVGGDAGSAACTVFSVEPALAQANDVVTIEGDFEALSSATVMFPGGASAMPGVTGNRLFTTVPAGAGTGPVTVQGCTGSAAFREVTFAVGLGPVFQLVDNQTAYARVPPQLTMARDHGTAVVADGCVFAIGGIGAPTTVEAAPIAADGTIGAFASAGTLTQPREDHASIVVKGVLYVIGGAPTTGQPYVGSGSIEAAALGSGCSLGPFAPVGSGLVGPHSQPAVAVIGNRLYVAGGNSVAIEFAALDDPELAFAPTVSLSTRRSGAAAAVIGSDWYVMGGDPSATNQTSYDVFPIAADGSIAPGSPVIAMNSAWPAGAAPFVLGNTVYGFGGDEDDSPGSATAALPIAQGSAGAAPSLPFAIADALTPVIAGNSVYLLGGRVNDVDTDAVPTAMIASIAGGATLGIPTSATAELGSAFSDFSIAVVGDNVLTIGGAGAVNDLPTISSAPVAPDGTPADFQSTGIALTNELAGTAAVEDDVEVVVYGGTEQGVVQDFVESATISSGALQSFGHDGALAMPLAGAGAVYTGGSVYIIGGVGSGSAVLKAIEEVMLPPAVGGMTPGFTLSTPRGYFGVAVIGSFVYVLGGEGSGGSDVEVITIGSNGALSGDESTMTLLRHTRVDPATVVVGNELCMIGGDTSGSGTYECATINPGGTIGAFALGSGFLTTPRAGARALVLGNNVYVIGGRNGSAELDSIEQIPLH